MKPDQQLTLRRDLSTCLWSKEKAEIQVFPEKEDKVLELIDAFMDRSECIWSGSASELIEACPGLKGLIKLNALTRKLNINCSLLAVLGTGPNIFSPNKSCTREQFVMMLWKMAGRPKTDISRNPFTDVSGSTSLKAVLWAYNEGIVKGAGDTVFAPDQNCKRLHLVTLLYKYNH